MAREIKSKNSGISPRIRLPRLVRRLLRLPSGNIRYELYDEALPAIDRVRPYTMVADEGLFTLYQQVAHIDRQQIPGAIVECGIWHGGSVALAALAHLKHGGGLRDFHLFDSFEGIPEPVADLDGARAVSDVHGRSKPSTGGELVVAWDYGERGGPGSVDTVLELLTDVGCNPDRLHVHKGWFQDTVPEAAAQIGPIALLRLDGDWYESTKVCLDHLYQYVTPGGFVVIDDYGAYEGCRKAVNEFLDGQLTRPFLSQVNSEIIYLIKP
jgi:O-methyltransferase